MLLLDAMRIADMPTLWGICREIMQDTDASEAAAETRAAEAANAESALTTEVTAEAEAAQWGEEDEEGRLAPKPLRTVWWHQSGAEPAEGGKASGWEDWVATELLSRARAALLRNARGGVLEATQHLDRLRKILLNFARDIPSGVAS